MTSDPRRLRIAIQKKGRLSDSSLDLIGRAGIRYRRLKDELLVRARNFPIDILLVRDDDIAPFLLSGVCDFGIVGGNVLEEELLDHNGASAETVMKLGFGQCTLKIAVPEGRVYDGVGSLKGERIATTYPNILGAYLKECGVDAEIVEMSGAVEVAPSLKIANAICDLVSTGATLEANGLKAVDTVYESEALLVKSPKPLCAEREETAARLLKRLRGVIATQDTKYIMLNAPKDALDDITAILPGAQSPTVVPLAGEGGSVAVHAVCQESVFWETLEGLKAAGASAILVLPIEKMLL